MILQNCKVNMFYLDPSEFLIDIYVETYSGIEMFLFVIYLFILERCHFIQETSSSTLW